MSLVSTIHYFAGHLAHLLEFSRESFSAIGSVPFLFHNAVVKLQLVRNVESALTAEIIMGLFCSLHYIARVKVKTVVKFNIIVATGG